MGKNKPSKKPFVSICTPTFNRRPFIPYIIKCFDNQTYPKDKMEWIIIDDGTDKIEDLVKDHPCVKYYKYDEKMTLGKKRNLSNEKSKGDIIIYMDDDDYYPKERVSHAVDTLLKNPKALCAGSSIMHIYFKHIHKMYQFGPYGPNHATAATFAFRKELLNKTKFEETSCVAAEKKFLKDYTVPFVQLDSNKTILVFSHIQNSFDKKELLKQMPNPFISETLKVPSDFVKEDDILKFFMEDIDNLLSEYKPGSIENKQDVIKALSDIKENRENMLKDEIKKQQDYQNLISKMEVLNPQLAQFKINDLTNVINSLNIENSQLKEKVKYLEDKLKNIVMEKIQERKHTVINI